MLLTILSQIKNKSSNKKNAENKVSEQNKKVNKKNKENINKNKKQKINKNNFKKQKNKKIRFSEKNNLHKKFFYDILHVYINSPQFILFCIVIVFMLIKSTSIITSKTLYLDGHFESISETKSIFIPNCTKMKKNELLKNKNIGDIVFYNYDKNLDSWMINNKKGLKLRVIEENDYYVFFEVLNLENTIIDINTLKNFSIYNMSETKVPLKHSFGVYKIYFSMNDTIDVLRNKYNIKEE